MNQQQYEVWEKEYLNLSELEKHFVDKTALSMEDIKHYESFTKRKLTKRELSIAACLKNEGCLLIETDFKP